MLQVGVSARLPLGLLSPTICLPVHPTAQPHTLHGPLIVTTSSSQRLTSVFRAIVIRVSIARPRHLHPRPEECECWALPLKASPNLTPAHPHLSLHCTHPCVPDSRHSLRIKGWFGGVAGGLSPRAVVSQPVWTLSFRPVSLVTAFIPLWVMDNVSPGTLARQLPRTN